MGLSCPAVDYSYFNARVHALISRLLPEETFTQLNRAGSVAEVLFLLRGGIYGDLAEIYNATGDIKMVELQLLRDRRQVFAGIRKHAPTPLLPLIEGFSALTDTEILKHALRLWFDQHVRGRSISDFIAYLPEEVSWNGVTPQQIANARTPEELQELLGKGGMESWVPALAAEIRETVQTRSLFYLELAVDNGSFALLLSRAERLGRTDAEVLAGILSEQIDARNITRCIRFPELFSQITPSWTSSQTAAHIQRVIIDGGARLSRAAVLRAIREGREKTGAADSVAQLIAASGFLESGQLPSLQPGAREQKRTARIELLDRMEHRLRQRMLNSARRAKSGDPFTIGTFAAYLILKGDEIDRIQASVHAAYYGAGPAAAGKAPASSLKEGSRL
jgi:vacuolar-type H+-ATPase subunit C/Vma6